MCRWILKSLEEKGGCRVHILYFFNFFSAVVFLIIHWAVCGPRRIAFTRSASWLSHLSFSVVSQNRSLFAFLWNLLPVGDPAHPFAIQPRLGGVEKKNWSSRLRRPWNILSFFFPRWISSMTFSCMTVLLWCEQTDVPDCVHVQVNIPASGREVNLSTNGRNGKHFGFNTEAVNSLGSDSHSGRCFFQKPTKASCAIFTQHPTDPQGGCFLSWCHHVDVGNTTIQVVLTWNSGCFWLWSVLEVNTRNLNDTLQVCIYINTYTIIVLDMHRNAKRS